MYYVTAKRRKIYRIQNEKIDEMTRYRTAENNHEITKKPTPASGLTHARCTNALSETSPLFFDSKKYYPDHPDQTVERMSR